MGNPAYSFRRLFVTSAALLWGASIAIVVVGSSDSTAIKYAGNRPAVYHVLGYGVSAWIPAFGLLGGAVLLGVVLFDRRSAISWIAIAVLFVLVGLLLVPASLGLSGSLPPPLPGSSLQR